MKWYDSLFKGAEKFMASPILVNTAYALFTALVFVSVVVAARREDDVNKSLTDVRPLAEIYEYSTDGGVTFFDCKDINSIDMRHLDEILLHGRVTQNIDSKEDAYIFINDIDADIRCGGEALNIDESKIPYYWARIEHGYIATDDIIEIELHTRGRLIYNRVFRMTLNRMFVASHGSLVVKMFRDNLINISGCVVMILIGICMIMYMIELSRYDILTGRGMFAGGMALIVGGLAFSMNPDYSTLLAENASGLGYIDPLALNLIILLVIRYLQRFIDDERRKVQGELTVFAAGFIISIFMIASLIEGVNTSYVVVLLVSDVLLIVLNMYFLAERLGKSDDRTFRGVVNAALLLLVCMVIEISLYVATGTYFINIIEIGLIIFGVVQYWAFAVENVEQRRVASRAKELEQELIQSQIDIMRSQIQPHFLFNALGTIRALCVKEPKEARNALDFFAKYLRANMESLDQKECIPFLKEMEHVKSYLYIEKLRFGDLLNIEYDLEATDFSIPCMTVQTLCENAVKHGLLSKENGGTLTIRSRESISCYEVQIIDDGVGFDATKKFDDSRTHVGVENSRKRLAGMCNGTLSIGSILGKGTTITITIPKVESL